MRNELKLLLPAVVIFLAAGCSSGSDGEGTGEQVGKPLDRICGGIFARGGTVTAALEALVDGTAVTDEASQPEAALKALTAPGEGKGVEGAPFCRVQAAGSGEWFFNIDVRQASAVPSGDDDMGGDLTYFSTGELASSTDSFAALYFKCRPNAGGREIIVNAELEQLDEGAGTGKGIRVDQMTVLNAAAQKIAENVRCGETKLVEGVPRMAG
ncbi:hypothetical protein GLX30_22025 [Streptomyces sp. Tu 2975]|uniref:hypothetical protein n=1 Tax=Streptomyces sp. Tu 2975 TaxID=2676871 RepID=UPI001359D643|nr:hypothetical protein [Streptomyces sp. Tu 2975]QIP86263.1 hypothetical protein GLX30_22025 [Streptomyces sp. Tu 2975]